MLLSQATSLVQNAETLIAISPFGLIAPCQSPVFSRPERMTMTASSAGFEFSWYHQTFAVKLIKSGFCLVALIIASISLYNSISTLRKRTTFGRSSAVYKGLLFSASLLWFLLTLATTVYTNGKAFFYRPHEPGYERFNVIFLTVLQVCSLPSSNLSDLD